MSDYTYYIYSGAANSAPNFTTLNGAVAHCVANDPTSSGTNGRVAASSTVYFKIRGAFTGISSNQVISGIDTTTNSNAAIVLTADTNPFNASSANAIGPGSYDSLGFDGNNYLACNQGNLIVENLIITTALAQGYGAAKVWGTSSTARAKVRNCILKCTATAAYYPVALRTKWTDVENSAMVVSSNDGTIAVVITYGDTTPDTFKNCTVVNLYGSAQGVGFQADEGIYPIVQNTYVGGVATHGLAGINAASTGNATSLSSGSGGVGVSLYDIALSTTNFESVTNGSENLKVKTGSSLKSAVAELAGVGADIFGTDRAATTTIGAHAAETEVSSGPSSVMGGKLTGGILFNGLKG